MDIDVGFWLTLALLVTVLIWLADRVFKLRRRPGATASMVETSNSLISVFLVVLVIRSFIVEPFTIPSGSMLPTLQVHDFILVNKFAYGLRLPVTNTKIIPTGEPERGDVMVFKFPQNTAQNFIKRVVGLPGDHIEVRDNVLYVNGEQVQRERVNELKNSRVWRREYVETLGEARHLIWQEGPVNPFSGEPEIPRRTQGEWTVPEGAYFVMGDNRDNSNDSRFWGFVPEELVVGQAFLIWMHWDPIFSLPSFSRNGGIDQVENKK
ncbi:signal peptidase I [Alloalcanivorax mobilis]|uniref:signal peptidase I n=1 Tax=Alloalcanivorax mobilis TaxID=2019569 RepID=UPI000B5B1E04|nr:signal peptidase I [Alloalcanivorax mobilis]ASK33490.1 signal peptidase I [Alcanivorax sp. N3-2A]|tara:strand:- start:35832 stop:36626 length:795 start_codon:yes stop_codon:yes gene_type:complete